MSVKIIGNKILLSEVAKENTTDSGIILTSEITKNSEGIIKGWGDEVKRNYHLNQKVVYKSWSEESVTVDKEKYLLISEEDILLIYE